MSNNKKKRSFEKYKQFQLKISRNVKLETLDLSKIKIIAGADVSYFKKKNRSVALVVVVYFNKELELIDFIARTFTSRFPYVPTYLAFKEAPPILKLFRQNKVYPDLLFLNGHGLLHPRMAGLATHVGYFLKTPTIGVAKKLLKGFIMDDPREITCNGKRFLVAGVYFSKTGIQGGLAIKLSKSKNWQYVSPGNRVDFSTTLEAVTRWTLEGELFVHPVEIADKWTKKLKQEFLDDVHL